MDENFVMISNNWKWFYSLVLSILHFLLLTLGSEVFSGKNMEESLRENLFRLAVKCSSDQIWWLKQDPQLERNGPSKIQ